MPPYTIGSAEHLHDKLRSEAATGCHWNSEISLPVWGSSRGEESPDSPEMSGASSDDNGAPQGCFTTPGKRRKTRENPAIKLQRELLQSVSALQPVDYVDWKRLILTDPDWCSWYMANNIKYKFQDRLGEALENYKLIAQQKNYLDLLETINMRSLEMKYGQYEKLFDSVAHIKEFFHHNQIDIEQAVKDVFQWADKEISKKNTIVVKGPPNCGKSLIINSIVTGMHNVCRANRFDNTGSQFSLQEGATARVWFMDEVHLQDKFWSTLLILWAGQPVDTDVKNKGHVDIPRVPVIMAFNDHPINNLPISMRGLAQSQLKARLITTWKAAEWPYCKNIKGQIHPQAWKYLYDEYILKRDTRALRSLEPLHGLYPHDVATEDIRRDVESTPIQDRSETGFTPPRVPGFSPRRRTPFSPGRCVASPRNLLPAFEASVVDEPPPLQGLFGAHLGRVEQDGSASNMDFVQAIADALNDADDSRGSGRDIRVRVEREEDAMHNNNDEGEAARGDIEGNMETGGGGDPGTHEGGVQEAQDIDIATEPCMLYSSPCGPDNRCQPGCPNSGV